MEDLDFGAERSGRDYKRQHGKSGDGKRKAATDQLPGIWENLYRGIRPRVYNNRTVSSGHIAMASVGCAMLGVSSYSSLT